MSTVFGSTWAFRSAATADTFDHNAVFLDAVRQDPVLSRVKLIAEPWDTGPEATTRTFLPAGRKKYKKKK